MTALAAPRPTKDIAQATRFWDRVAPKYARQKISDTDSYEQTMSRTGTYLSAEDRVLELGAGTGSTAVRLAPLVADYTASDFSHGMTAIAQERRTEAGVSNLRVVTAAPGDPQVAGPYDAVLAFNLLHLLPDLERDLVAIHASLRPGGVLIAKTSLLSQGGWYLRPMIAAMRLFKAAPYVAFLSGDGLRDMVRDAGFAVIEDERHPAGFAVIEDERHPAGSTRQFLVARKR